MRQRKLGTATVSAIGLGCMNVAHAYGSPPPKEEAQQLLRDALDLGYTHLDTAYLYGFGLSEQLIGETLADRRDEYFLASKCGIIKNAAGQREINNDPAKIRETCETSLQNLKTDAIDLYYLHRWDMKTPIEDAVGALADLVSEGKIKAIGLSEVSAATLKKAHAVHPIAALQSEYSLWTRNPEIAVLDACRELGTALVAFSPLARAFLGGVLRDVSTLAEKDLRRSMPRFAPDTYAANLRLLDEYKTIADEVGCTMAQLALAWTLAKGDDILPIPGTANRAHLAENAAADAIDLDAATVARLDALINEKTVIGPRYNAKTQTEIDTEEFAA
ncbi:MAG: aldo/keto reductase [Hyphomicrobiales bacterium]|nr:MAG: aldo/keto reductase [Hyphomicrobiales bacterium]